MYLKKRENFTSTHTDYDMKGYIAQITKNIIDQWILPAPFANPALLEMFKNRDHYPYRDLERWSGEFAGKYLIHCIEFYDLTEDKILKNHIDWFVDELIKMQGNNGYLGPWPKQYELMGFDHQNVETWDAWGHYLLMLGMTMWYEDTNDQKALDCACKIGDLICNTFLDKEKRIIDIGVPKVNFAPMHSLCILYKITGVKRYLDMAREIEKDFQTPPAGVYPAGDYIREALAGKEFYQMPETRWEGLHTIQGIAELYYITGDEKYRQAFEHIWWSIVKTDRHNTGGFSTNERAVGSQFVEGPIETCCTVAWMALSVDMLKLTGNSVVADELELSMLNTGLGAISPSGRWCTYDTPRDGVRKASAHSIVFQAREGASELNCCSVNGPRAISLLRDWAVMREGKNIVLNYYGQIEMSIPLKSGNHVKLIQETEYPKTGKIRIGVYPKKDSEFAIKLRIPYWSEQTKIKVNGETMYNVAKGQYYPINREWEYGDMITVELDMGLHFWKSEVGEKYKGKSSIYRGPILLTYDRKFNKYDLNDIPELDAKMINNKEKFLRGKVRNEYNDMYDNRLKPRMLFKYESVEGKPVFLCDFASAGDGGSRYVSWLFVKNTKSSKFIKDNPLRSTRVEVNSVK